MADGLNPDDPGVRLLARALTDVPPERALLLHCGELPGIDAGATRLVLHVREHTGSRHRCVPDVAAGLPASVGEGQYDAAASWPRAHLGKDFSERALALGALALAEGGRLLCAVRKQKGGKSLARTMKALLGERAVAVEARERGYHLWVGTRGPTFDEGLARELASRRYLIEDEALGRLRLHSAPGVFCRRELDRGTRALLEVASAIDEREGLRPARVLDRCAGIGPLALWAAARWPSADVLAVESNLRACALLEQSAREHDLGDRVTVVAHDGMPDAGSASSFAGAVELALMNPPTHADPETLGRLLDLREWMSPRGRLLLVVNRPGRAVEHLTNLGATLEGGERDGYFVLQARFGPRKVL